MNYTIAHHKEKHEFAFYIESLSSLVRSIPLGEMFIIVDDTIVHRIVAVLRLRIGERCVFFDSQIYIVGVIVDFIGKKNIKIKLESKDVVKPFYPHITVLLPLLKRDDFEQALYSLTEVGVNSIQLITTKKSTSSFNQRDFDRAKRIMISALEQSKNYAYPELKGPTSLEQAFDISFHQASMNIFFDPMGKDFFSTMQELYTNRPRRIVILIGPEGDLTAEEKNMAKEKGFIFCALTPTILRAVQAVALGAGFVRSVLASTFDANVFK